jgi:hypothetical protein
MAGIHFSARLILVFINNPVTKMPAYSTSNSRSNSDKFGLFFIVSTAAFVGVFSYGFNFFTVFIYVTSIIVFAVAMVSWYRQAAFVLNFNDNGIEQVYTYRGNKMCFAYEELKQVHYLDGKGIANVFVLQKENKPYTIKVTTVCYGEKYVAFIKWLKIKNPDFETHVAPKGTTMHMRLRQELLGYKY